MHVKLKKVTKENSVEETLNLKGELSISITELLGTLISLKGKLRGRFIRLLLGSFLRTYILQVPRGNEEDFNPSELPQEPYPTSTHHELETEDGCIISCRQWKCNQNQCRLEGEQKLSPVLLINGHSTESYCLPTEPNDLIRTLLEEGHEVWLLQPRLHPLNSSNSFTIEDIGRFDIPAVVRKIHELHGPLIKVHVVAHCVGGLAMHIALMGGHVSATHISSLSCTNSSMFFKLTASSKIKMWLPIIPISMVILGQNKILPLFETLKASLRHRLLKSIARLVPRYERCTYDECEVLSGVFGNAFWHDNLSLTMHYWLNKQSIDRIPMAAFPHLRKICKAGFIVDSDGRNSYLIHPERMALPTLYISGGRTLLVTPETSFLANKYMKLHQPGFRHGRVVVEGFGHSDLLIGEESYKKVFPHILSHIRLNEQGINNAMDAERRKYSKDALAWGDDPYEEGSRVSGSWISHLLTIIWFLFLLLVMLSYIFL
ncbi:uncharacterized protein LOC132293268 [Cornus florida]|uniref:uncharacterized protein LOC132293268 n=1 Tax=Cornus florida TaxID=4283 RepID=UPI00289C515C|nr:uncharacterized protein LOC132293268 [Cornus florida]